MSKGSKQRPTNSARYSANWDRIFNKDKADLEYESGNPLERPYEPGKEDNTFWKHLCKKDHDCLYYIETGAACNWCGKLEDGNND